MGNSASCRCGDNKCFDSDVREENSTYGQYDDDAEMLEQQNPFMPAAIFAGTCAEGQVEKCTGREETGSSVGVDECRDFVHVEVDGSSVGGLTGRKSLPVLVAASPVIAPPSDAELRQETPADDCGFLSRHAPQEYPGVPLAEGVECLTPELIYGLLRDGTCLLIDVRGGDRAAGIIEGAIHVPAISVRDPFAARLPELVRQLKDKRLIVFFCQFCKHRAPFCANAFREKTNEAGNTCQRIAVMEGGFRGWQKTGLPVKNEGSKSEQAFLDALARHQGMLIQKP